MSIKTGMHDDPDPRSELFALIEAASLSHPIGEQKLKALLKIQENLRASQEQLAQWLLVKKITKTEYVAKLDTVMRENARAGEEVLGFDDFHKVFGEFSVQSILDVKAFVGATDGGGFVAH
jgi:hypothetical protein